jgi:glycosyltransferase involved in cell wall biosynthesis
LKKKVHNNFLLITNIYPPSFAPRMGYMLKYLTRKGWTATVITRLWDGDTSFQSLVDLLPKPIRLKVGKISFKNKVEAICYNLFYPVYFYYEAYKIYRVARKEFRKQSFDFVFCCISYHNYMLQASVWLARSFKVPMITDFRDLEEQIPKSSSTESRINRYIIQKNQNFISERKKILIKKSTQITTVSNWHKHILHQYNRNVEVIHNGFDADIYKPELKIINNNFEIIYTGTILFGRHDVDLLFSILVYLRDICGNFKFETLKISFYTPENCRNILKMHRHYYTFENNFFFHDFVDTSEVPHLLNNASILLLLSNVSKTDGPKGLESTTKYFEYLAVRKPILCARSDEAGLEASIRNLNAGCAARTAEQGASFIMEKYREWIDKGYTTQNSDYETIQNFSREKHANQFEEVFMSVLND